MATTAKQVTEGAGWDSDYYAIPEGATDLQDLIEHKNMNFARANIFKAAYRAGDKEHDDPCYDYRKVIWFALREIARITKERALRRKRR